MTNLFSFVFSLWAIFIFSPAQGQRTIFEQTLQKLSWCTEGAGAVRSKHDLNFGNAACCFHPGVIARDPAGMKCKCCELGVLEHCNRDNQNCFPKDSYPVKDCTFNELNTITKKSNNSKVQCCSKDGLDDTILTCGQGGIPCEDICGKADHATLVLTSDVADDQICLASATGRRKRGNVAVWPIYMLSHCVFRVTSDTAVDSYPECCFHIAVSLKITGVKKKCCALGVAELC